MSRTIRHEVTGATGIKGVLDRIASVHQDLGSELAKGKQLRCGICKGTQPLSGEQAARYLRKGWPTCHGFTMALEALP